MASTDRQNRLLVAEDWKRIYQTYQTADFQSYDFESLKRVMISYIRENYPEDFNDYIQSSEYIALIDLIAYLGQNLSFRVDLNARENFLELAERRESILRLARLLSYNPKRNVGASGLLKITSVRTTENATDSNNLSLTNQNIVWNDPSNPNWYEQFIKVCNLAFDNINLFGSPLKKENITNIDTSVYRVNTAALGDLPLFTITKTLDGSSYDFEIVPADINGTIVEDAPAPNSKFKILYREDGVGPNSPNTGFFCLFKQGTLDYGDFEVTNPSQNQLVTVDAINVNNDDVWLYSLENSTDIDTLWTKVDSIEGNNVIYNDVAKKIRTVYGVLTRVNDRISLIFSDGIFGDLPKGNFRIYYRTSRNQNLVITPRDMLGIGLDIEYVSSSNKLETLSLVLELQYTINNSSVSEDNESIRKLAPMNYYTQNRLITAEDYQIGPLVSSNQIVKAKSVNRLSSGISRYFDLTDATGAYSKTNVYGTDGILYQESFVDKLTFNYNNVTEVENVLYNVIDPLLKTQKIKNYYYSNVTRIPYTDQGISWVSVTNDINLNTGYLKNEANVKQVIGQSTTSILQYIKINTHIKFFAPAGYYFNADRELVPGDANVPNSTTYFWVKVIATFNDGTELNEDDSGPIYFNDKIPTGSVLGEIRPFLSKGIAESVKTEMIDQIIANKTFGLRYDRVADQWLVVLEEDLNLDKPFNLGKAGDTTGQKLDSSWLLKFSTNLTFYTVEYRASRFIFESKKEVNFYFDKSDKIYNSVNGETTKDKIVVLSINTKPITNTDNLSSFTKDYDWAITNNYRDQLGYITSKKIEVDFFDSDDDGVSDDEDLFQEIVQPNVNDEPFTFIFQKKVITSNGVETYNYVSNDELKIIIKKGLVYTGPLSQYSDGQIVYFVAENIFQTFNKSINSFSITNDYKGFIGRDKLQFRYLHAADYDNRIDPSISNIIDVYLLTKSYDDAFRGYLSGNVKDEPLVMSSTDLYLNFSGPLEKIKSVTDEIIYHPAQYRMLFGSLAHADLQGIFKVIKNVDLVINDNDIKAKVITTINQFFSIENWSFGETFYMSELTAYLMKEMSPDISSIILVPRSPNLSFGSLYEVRAEDNEILISCATVADVEIIEEINAESLNSDVISNATIPQNGILTQ